MQVHQDGDYERLQTIANAISNLYQQHGLYRGVELEPSSDVKLHMTLLNSRYRFEKHRHKNDKSKGRKVKRRSFNAEGLLKDFGDYSFAEGVVCDTISLCKMHAGGDPNAFYPTVAELKLKALFNEDAK